MTCITSEELARTAPLPPSTPRYQHGAMPIQPVSPRTSRLAIAAFIFGLIGIPLFGLITGFVAVVFACMAMATIYQTPHKGMGWASAGLALGLVDVVGWIFLLYSFVFTPTAVPMRVTDMKFDPAELRHVKPELQRAMRANVVVNLGFHGTGSGVILKIDKGRAVILTNRHVISPGFGAYDDTAPTTPGGLEVVMLSQSAVPGHVEWVAPDGIDAAVISAPCNNQEAVATNVATGTPTQIGDEVFAVGNPYALGWTLSRGTVSQIRIRSYGLTNVRIIQTETAINPGNSGGGLYDQAGHLIGINTWTNDKSVSEGLNFAIAFDSLRLILPSLFLPEMPSPARAATSPEQP